MDEMRVVEEGLDTPWARGPANFNDFHSFSIVLCKFTFLLLSLFSELFKASVELFWATLNFTLALEKLLGSSLGAANGSLRAHNHLTDSMDRNFGALEDLLEALLVAFGSSWRPH